MRHVVQQVRADVGYVLRVLWRQAGSSLIVILTLGIGIGSEAAMFGIADRLLLQPPAAVREPHDVRRLLVSGADGGRPYALTSYPVLASMRADTAAFRGAAGYMSARAQSGEGLEAVEVRVLAVTGSFFDLLGVPAAHGSLIRADDAGASAVLSHDYWASAMHADSSIVGKPLTLNGRSFRVIGVTPAGFTGVDLESVDMFVPLAAAPLLGAPEEWQTAASSWLRVLVRTPTRLPEASLGTRATRALQEANRASGLPQEILAQRAHLAPLSAARAAERQLEMRMSVVLGILSIAVLLSAAANATYVMFAQTLRRRPELAVKIALGMSRRRLAWELFLESLVLVAGACAFALLVAHVGGDFLRRWLLPDIRWSGSPLGGRTVTVAVVAAFALAAATAYLRARHAWSLRVADALAGGRATPAHRTFRRVLLVSQAAFAMLVVSASLLFVQTLRNVQAIETGVDLDRVLHVSVETDDEPASVRNARYATLAAHAARVPGVERATPVVRSVPLVSAYGISIRVPDLEPPPRIAGAGPYYSAITPDFFPALGTRVVAGRGITSEEHRLGARVAVVNETMARRWWRGAAPMGQCVRMGSDSACTDVVGVVEDVIKFRLIGEPQAQMLYVPSTHPFVGEKPVEALLVRSTIDGASLISALRRALAPAVPRTARVQVQTYEQLLAPQVRPFRLAATVLSAFAVVTVLICAAGLFGVMTYTVTQRQREFGIRRALGATAPVIVGIVLREGLAVVIIGIVLGVAGAWLGGRFITSLLYGITPGDPVVLGATAMALILVGIAAGLWPALRATRVSPDTAIRTE